MKVLVGCPIFDGMRYCFREFLNRIKELDYPNYDILLVDNSKGDRFFEELKKEEVIVIRDKINGLGIAKVISSRNKILDYAVVNGYDYVLMMDPDVIPPINLLSGLIKCDKEVVSGLYYNNFYSSGNLQWLPVAWKSVSMELFNTMKENYPDLFKGIDSPEGMMEYITSEDIKSAKLIKVLIPSPGCMLLSRKVFETIRYEMPLNPKPNQTDEIYFFEISIMSFL